MNQILKDTIYTKGSRKQIEFISELGGMNEEEKTMLNLYHTGHTDLFVMEEMGLDRKSHARVEESMRAKLLLAVFECIHYYYDHHS